MEPVIIVLIILLVIFLAIVFFIFFFNIELKRQKKKIKEIENNHDAASLIKYKNELGTISKMNLENDTTKEIEYSWNEIEKIKINIRKKIRDINSLLSKKNIFKTLFIFKEIQNMKNKINRKDKLFFKLTNSILIDRKIILNQVNKYKKTSRDIKLLVDEIIPLLHEDTINALDKYINEMNVFFREISIFINSKQEKEAKMLLVNFVSFFNEFILYLDKCRGIDQFLFVDCPNFEKKLINEFQKLKTITNSNLIEMNFELRLNNIKEKTEIFKINYQKEGKEENFNDMKEILKQYSDLAFNLQKEKKFYSFFKAEGEKIKNIYKDLNKKVISVSEISEKTSQIDPFYFNDWNELKLKIKSLLENITEIFNSGFLEIDYENTYYSKNILSLKQILNQFNVINSIVEEQYSKIKYFFYESSSEKLNFEIIIKMNLIFENVFLEEGFEESPRLKLKKDEINRAIQKIQNIIIKGNEEEFTKYYDKFYNMNIKYFLDASILLYEARLYKKLLGTFNKKRSSNAKLHQNLKMNEQKFVIGKYNEALNELINITKGEIH